MFCHFVWIIFQGKAWQTHRSWFNDFFTKTRSSPSKDFWAFREWKRCGTYQYLFSYWIIPTSQFESYGRRRSDCDVKSRELPYLQEKAQKSFEGELLVLVGKSINYEQKVRQVLPWNKSSLKNDRTCNWTRVTFLLRKVTDGMGYLSMSGDLSKVVE